MLREFNSEPSDREQRAELEQLQTELQEARAQLSRGAAPSASRLAALEVELIKAQAFAEAAHARATALQAEEAELTEQVRLLDRQIEEAQVLKRGASRRDKYLEWVPPFSPTEIHPRGDPPDAGALLVMIAAFFFVFITAIVILATR